MGIYCKAYRAKKLREFNGWTENIQEEIPDDTILYLHKNYIVTKSFFLTEDIVFTNNSPEWKEFCHNTLEFKVPYSTFG